MLSELPVSQTIKFQKVIISHSSSLWHTELNDEQLTPWSLFLLQKLIASQIAKISPPFVETKTSLTSQEDSAARLFPEPYKSNPHPPILFLYDLI
jgi:hypothetical protein